MDMPYQGIGNCINVIFAFVQKMQSLAFKTLNGVFMHDGTLVRLPHIVGMGHGTVLSGELINAEHAHKIIWSIKYIKQQPTEKTLEYAH